MQYRPLMRSILSGILISFLSLAFILGSFSLGLLETKNSTQTPPLSFEPSLTALYASINRISLTMTYLPPGATPLIPLTSGSCSPPDGWVPIIVQPTDTIEAFSMVVNISSEELVRSNCLDSTSLVAGQVLFLPPYSQPTSSTCIAPIGWIPYTVKNQDTLSLLAFLYNVTIPQIQAANCMGSSVLLLAGQILYLPDNPFIIYTSPVYQNPSSTPTLETFTLTPSLSLSETTTPSITFTNTFTIVPTNTVALPPTETFTIEPTSTP